MAMGRPKSSTQFCRVKKNHRSRWNGDVLKVSSAFPTPCLEGTKGHRALEQLWEEAEASPQAKAEEQAGQESTKLSPSLARPCGEAPPGLFSKVKSAEFSATIFNFCMMKQNPNSQELS